MIGYEIQLRYVIRDKIQSEKKIFCLKKKTVRKLFSPTGSNQSELSSTLSGISSGQ